MLAAKVYRPRKLRNLRNDALYREGRPDVDGDGKVLQDDGMLHAMRKKTRYGAELLHTSWIGHEYSTLQDLHAASADVPRPFASDSNAILMDYIGDETMAAQPLITVSLEPDEVKPLFERSMRNIEIMLAHGSIHGDLSAYNILYWDGEITLIDFPQAINPSENRSAYRIFERDIVRVCEYFARQGNKTGIWERVLRISEKSPARSPLQPHRLAADLWTAYRYKLEPELDPAILNDEDEQDVAMWKASHSGGSITTGLVKS